jgi:hypothetical protein
MQNKSKNANGGVNPNADDQIDVIDPFSPDVQESFDLDRLDDFVIGLGVEFMHYKSIPSPIGQKDRGDYRRSDGVDTITSNGMIYRCSGKFTATMTDNSHERRRGGAGILDPAESKLVMPRFYNKVGLDDGNRIYALPGDRLYVADPSVDVLVSMSQKMDYDPYGDNIPMFPIADLEMPIVDSRNMEYDAGVDFCITADGNIRWIEGGRNPGIDPDTNKGRIYSVRYLYRAYWYITTILKEVRITGVTEGGVRTPERMSYHVMLMREFMFHNQNRGDQLNQLKSKDPKRVDAKPVESTNPEKYEVPVEPITPHTFTIPVDMDDFGDENE